MKKKAIVLFPSNNSYSTINNLHGFIYFYQENDNNVIVRVKLSGLPTGIHGFHIHEKELKYEHLKELKNGNNIKNLCNELGGHFNPFLTNHGSYQYNTERHAGDLINNLEVDLHGKVDITFIDNLISLNKNALNCIINRSIVIHEEEDDQGLPGLCALMQNKKLNKLELESLKTGNAGKRIACGNIILIE